jgi:FtsZ-binding cell division protein ZapB
MLNCTSWFQIYCGALTFFSLLQATVKELKESNQTLQKELQDEKSNHQMTQLRAEKQEEWNRRELAQLKDELADKKKLMDNMISKELYKRDLDNLKIQNQTALV